ncbi:MAG: Crp/Fnr family transcriptional regulator [Bacteroidetes bacterium]|nr:Crp/Fnr family transcriptional regulator [Bacteroidota bacterium]
MYPHLRNKIEAWTGPVPNPEWEDFLTHWEPVSFEENVFITQFGQQELYFYWVIEGLQRAFFVHEGNEICIGFTYYPDFSGVYDAFLEKSPANFALQCLSASQLLRLHVDSYHRLLDRYTWVERLYRRFNEQMFLAKARHEIAVFTYSAEERYRRLLRAAPHLFQLVPQKHLASYLSMTPETFSRLRNRVRD